MIYDYYESSLTDIDIYIIAVIGIRKEKVK